MLLFPSSFQRTICYEVEQFLLDYVQCKCAFRVHFILVNPNNVQVGGREA